jgi:transcriptional regulator with XRE-family HTH domain
MPTTSAAARDRRVRGRALRELRQRADITPEELAARVGTDDAYVSRVETGRLDGPLAYLAATLRA